MGSWNMWNGFVKSQWRVIQKPISKGNLVDQRVVRAVLKCCLVAILPSIGIAAEVDGSTQEISRPDPYANLKITIKEEPITKTKKRGPSEKSERLNSAAQSTGVKKASIKQSDSVLSRATAELVVEKSDLSAGFLTTPGTVQYVVEPLKNPVSGGGFELAVSAQIYRPAGVMKLPSMEAFDVATAGARPMAGIEARWFSFNFNRGPQVFSLGPFLSFGYAQFPVKLRTPSGAAISKSELHLLRAALGGGLGWQPSQLSAWSARFDFGFGQFTETLASTSSYANHTATTVFAGAGIFLQRRVFERWGLFLGYESRYPVRGEPDELKLQRENVMAGLTGSFR